MIREARPEDIQAIYKLGLEAHRKSHYSHIPVDEAKFKQLVIMLATNAQHVVLVDERKDKLVGFLLGMREEIFFSRKKYATDLMVYGTTPMSGARLAKRFVSWARERGVAQIILGISTDIVDETRVGKLYENLGLARSGGLYQEFPGQEK